MPRINPIEQAGISIELTDQAIKRINAQRSLLGAKQNTFEHAKKNVDNMSEQLLTAESKIEDADIAKEMMELTKQNILIQSTQAMISQSNTIPQQVLNLLK
ncbi:flagellin [Clostridiaceae bacterium HSG29]|nr:flagellin [Clostridiaceae bacterium HSG29]